MSGINEFAKDLVKRQIEIYHEYQSKNNDMTQPLAIVMCCSIIIYSDYIENYIENHNGSSLIENISGHDTNEEFKNYIKGIYGDNFQRRLDNYCYNDKKTQKEQKFLNDKFQEYEIFFHDLRNEFAHIHETGRSILSPVNDSGFNGINIHIGNGKTEINISISKDNIIKLIKLIDTYLK